MFGSEDEIDGKQKAKSKSRQIIEQSDDEKPAKNEEGDDDDDLF